MSSDSDKPGSYEALEFIQHLDEASAAADDSHAPRRPQAGFPNAVNAEELFSNLTPGSSQARIADYEILSKLGQGGMGVVYEAKHLALDRRVALKLLPVGPENDEVAVQRFTREARSAAAMHHTNIVPVFDVGCANGLHYYAMQLIEGVTLSDVVKTIRQARQTGGTLDLTGADLDEESVSVARSLWRSSEDADARSALEVETLHSEEAMPADASTEFSYDMAAANSHDVDQGNQGSAPHTLNTLTEGGHAEQSKQGTDAGQEVAVGPTGTEPQALPSAKVPTAELTRYFRGVAELGAQASDALEYAHARGIVHRDIKPGNLMLDKSGNVWVTDFGLAKTVDDDLTHTGGIVGTLRYMSPERFRGSCTESADLYALGITLYEMLALQPAFRTTDHATLMDSIQNQPIPSLRLLEPKIPLDLETIVSKAIEKDPSRRYGSAADMAADLRRFVAGEPIHARKVSRLEKAYLWAKNNKSIAALSASLLASLIVGLIVSVSFAVLAANRAVKAEEGTRVAAAQTQVALETLRTVIYSVQEELKPVKQAREVRRKLLKEVVTNLEQVANGFVDESVVSRDSAKALNDLGAIVLEIGDELGSDVRTVNRQYHRKAVNAYLQLVEESPNDLDLLKLTGDCVMEFGNNAREFQEFELAIWAHEQNIFVARLIRQAVRDPQDVYLAGIFTIKTKESLGEALLRSNQLDRAKKLCLEAAELAKQLSDETQSGTAYDMLNLTHSTLGDFYRAQGDFENAEAAYQTMLSATQKWMELSPEDPENDDLISSDYERIGDLEFERKNYEKAREYYEKMLEYSEAYMAADPENLIRMKRSTWAYQRIIKVCTVQGELERAEWARQELAEIRRKLSGN